MAEKTPQWIMAEALDPTMPMTVVSVGGRPREFTNLHRPIQDALEASGVRNPARNLKEWVSRAFYDARDYKRTVERPVGGGTNLTIICVPVLGPYGDVHAVQGWIGDLSKNIAPPVRRAAGVVFDYKEQMITQPIESIRLSGVPDEEYVRKVSLAEIIERGEKVEHVQQLLDLSAKDPVPGESLRFPVKVPHMAGYTMRWQVTIRSRNDRDCVGAWWVWEDMTSEDNEPVFTTLEEVGYKAAHERAGIYIAVVHLGSATIPHWLTKPAPWISYKYLLRASDVFHPQDRERIMNLAHEPVDEIVVRTLHPDPGYTYTRLILTPYPGLSASRQLMIAQVELESDPRERIPLEPDFDRGHTAQRDHFERRTAKEEGKDE